MKCDELKNYDVQGARLPAMPGKGEFVKRADVDAAIAELKERDRKTQRALWLARAAMCRTYDSCAYFIEKPDSKRRFTDFFVLMQKAAATAAIKAEEYK